MKAKVSATYSIRSQVLLLGRHILMVLQSLEPLGTACILLGQLISKEIYLVNLQYT